MEQVDFLVIGAGVVGLAICAEISTRFKNASIVLLERHNKFGQETSSRNSEVIHSGIYYPKNSLKAKLCTEGNRLLYDFCEKWDVPHQRIGKLIIARNEEEIKTLESLKSNGNKNGILDLEILEKNQLERIEPNIKAIAAIFLPSTGIIDSHILMTRLESISDQQGVLLAYGHDVIGVETANDGYAITYRLQDGTTDSIESRCLINCAGLYSDKIAEMTGIDIDKAEYRLRLCKGEYFSVRNLKSGLISHLIYPPPLKNLKGLGIHVTKSLDGNIRLGPNAFYVDTIEYTVDVSHAEVFYNSVKEFLPFLEYSDIEADMSGIRPKLYDANEQVRDFIITHETNKGLPGVINLIGIESPGLTSCLSISKYVADLINGIDGLNRF